MEDSENACCNEMMEPCDVTVQHCNATLSHHHEDTTQYGDGTRKYQDGLQSKKKEGNVQKVVPFILVLFGRTEACSFWLVDWLDDWIICWMVDFENRILCSLGCSPTQ